jgi:hypothetical protein
MSITYLQNLNITAHSFFSKNFENDHVDNLLTKLKRIPTSAVLKAKEIVLWFAQLMGF